jgi:hypothetical protein
LAEWPDYNKLKVELHNLAEARRAVSMLNGDAEEGKISANKTVAEGKVCFNCGKGGHFRLDCRSPAHKCSICGGTGHLEVHCRDKKDASWERPRGDASGRERPRSGGRPMKAEAKRNGSAGDKPRGAPRPFKKPTGKQKVLRKAFARMAEEVYGEDSGYSSAERSERQAGDATDDDGQEDSGYGAEGYMLSAGDVSVNTAARKRVAHTHTKSNGGDTTIIMDTGCKGAHVLKQEAQSLVSNQTPSTAAVEGIGGTLKSETRGTLGKLGPALVVPKMGASLLSVMEFLRSTKGSFRGDEHVMEMLDADGQVVLTGHNHGDGFWKCTSEDLRSAAYLLDHEADDADHDVLDALHGDPIAELENPALPGDGTPHFTGEERSRALQARQLCYRNGHPGRDALCRALDNRNYPNVELTSQDVRNAEVLYGPCPACLEGKMKADRTPKQSVNAPAPTIGHTLHCDLIPLRSTSLGGNRVLLFSVDEKSGYIILVSLQNKGTTALCNAFDSIIGEYKSHGHIVYTIQHDHESNFLSCKTYVNNKGVQLNGLPANHHEKLAERNIQTLKSRRHAMLAGLHYELPDALEAESYHAAAYCMNITPRSRSGAFTPYQLVTRSHPLAPRFAFGEIGLFHKRRADNPDMRAEWGIFISQGKGPRDFRAYLPHRTGLYSLMKFVPNHNYPTTWNLKPRIRPPDPKVKAEPGLTVPPTVKPDPMVPPPALPKTDAPVPSPTSAAAPVEQMIKDQEGRSLVQHHAPATQPTQRSISTTAPAIRPTPPPAAPPRMNPEGNQGPEGIPTARAPPAPAPTRAPPAPDPPRASTRTPRSLPAPVVPMAAPPPAAPAAATAPPAGTHAPAARPDPEPPPPRRPTRAAAKHNWQDGPAKFRANLTDTDLIQVNTDPHGPLAVVAYRLSLKKALLDKQRRASTLAAIASEIRNMEDADVATMVHYRDIPDNERKNVVPAHMFIKDKYKADGSFDKVKARLVGNGDRQHPDTVGETFSPTVNPISVFTLLNVAACNGTVLAAYDIKGAFLLTPMTEGKKVYLRIPPEVAEHWVTLYPHRAKYLSREGCLYVRLKKFIYGLQEASREFNLFLHDKLTAIGFRPTRADRCLYVRRTKQGIMIVGTHVDDILLAAPTMELRTWFEKELEKSFEIVKQYDDLSYLGMNIKYDAAARKIRVSQSGAIRDTVARQDLGSLPKPPKTPAVSEDIFSAHADSPDCDKSEFLSLVMSLMYPARLTRPDILMPVTAMATHSAKPTAADMSNLYRMVRYLAGTPDYFLEFDGSVPIKPAIYADASHNVYPDGLGHAGIFITLGSAPILSRSFKLKFVTRSSSESELYALEEASTYAGWLRMLLNELGVKCDEPVRTYQDNKSAIIIAQQGGNFKRLKHLLVREAFVQERIKFGDILLQYLGTNEMPADMLTKPLSGPKLQQHMDTIHLRDTPGPL